MLFLFSHIESYSFHICDGCFVVGEVDVLWCSLHVDSAPLLRRGDGRVTRRVGPCLRPGVDSEHRSRCSMVTPCRRVTTMLDGEPGASNVAPEAGR